MARSSNRRTSVAHTLHELQIIDQADRWEAYLFAGPGQKHVIPCATEAEAKAAARALADEHRRPALVYAIAGEASAVLASVGPILIAK